MRFGRALWNRLGSAVAEVSVACTA